MCLAHCLFVGAYLYVFCVFGIVMCPLGVSLAVLAICYVCRVVRSFLLYVFSRGVTKP